MSVRMESDRCEGSFVGKTGPASVKVVARRTAFRELRNMLKGVVADGNPVEPFLDRFIDLFPFVEPAVMELIR